MAKFEMIDMADFAVGLSRMLVRVHHAFGRLHSTGCNEQWASVGRHRRHYSVPIFRRGLGLECIHRTAVTGNYGGGNLAQGAAFCAVDDPATLQSRVDDAGYPCLCTCTTDQVELAGALWFEMNGSADLLHRFWPVGRQVAEVVGASALGRSLLELMATMPS